MVLAEFDKTVVEVAGHTDSTGTEDYNMQLSQRRAQSVVAYLGTRNVRADRMIAIGGGEGHPVATNDTDVGRQQNRRVELTLVPLTLES
jgi:outer membrane protein OmpA-like peptidoglycan-associated protein